MTTNLDGLEDGAAPHVIAMIVSFLRKWPDAEFGPAHIVLSDHNLGDEHIRWCLGVARAALSRDPVHLLDPAQDLKLMNRLNWYAESGTRRVASCGRRSRSRLAGCRSARGAASSRPAAPARRSRRVIGFIGPHRPVPRRRMTPVRTQHRRCLLAFCKSIGDRRLRVHDHAVANLHQQVPQIGQARRRVVRFPIQPRVGIRRRRMRVVLCGPVRGSRAHHHRCRHLSVGNSSDSPTPRAGCRRP
jgi:hypothetical protein